MADSGMSFKEVVIDASEIVDWPSFHSLFAKAFGFPVFYGRNMDAWIDCMTDLDDPGSGMSAVHAPRGGIALVTLLNAKAFASRCPEQAAALNDCAAFVNWQRCEQGRAPVLALSYHR